MTYERPNCPECGQLAEGTVETLEAVATFGEDYPTEYSGFTEVIWDTQRTVEPLTLQCPDGHRWHDDGTEDQPATNGLLLVPAADIQQAIEAIEAGNPGEALGQLAAIMDHSAIEHIWVEPCEGEGP